MTAYLIDAASFQGVVVWSAVDAVCAGGWEKVTQGLGYVNPYWPGAKASMAARARATGFVPGGYHFLTEGSGGAQADFFARACGGMAGFGIGVDVEPSTARPGMVTAREFVSEVRKLFPGTPVGGYIPHWYWGDADTTFVDYLWASNYVLGAGAPQVLIRRVTPAQWAPYGGRVPALLQFTSQAVVPGVWGFVDCSACQGDLAAVMLPAPPPPPPPTVYGLFGDPMYVQFTDVAPAGSVGPGSGGAAVACVPPGAKVARFSCRKSTHLRVTMPAPAGLAGDPTAEFDLGYGVAHDVPVDGAGNNQVLIIHRDDQQSEPVDVVFG